MTKKYLSARTRTKHTYAFYKERWNNPQWRDDFIQVRSQRRKALFIQTIVILIIIAGGAVYFSKATPMKRVVEQSATSSSTTARTESTKEPSADPAIAIRHNSSDEEQVSISESSNSMASTESSNDNHDTTSSTTMADDDVDYIADGFLMAPVKYNGEDATEAMEANRAPQNLIHDGYTNGYIKDDTTVRVSNMGTAFNSSYQIADGVFVIQLGASQHKFRYSVNNGSVSFENKKLDEPDGANVELQLKKDTNAREVVDSRQLQN